MEGIGEVPKMLDDTVLAFVILFLLGGFLSVCAGSIRKKNVNNYVASPK
jgi:hypothetical protein